MPPETYLLYALILACEVGFWVVLLVALAVRYLLGKERLSRALLLCLPLVDVLLLVFTAVDLRRGSTATFAHGLAAAYVGFTVAFGGMAQACVRLHRALVLVWSGVESRNRMAPFALTPTPLGVIDAGVLGVELVRTHAFEICFDNESRG